MRKKKDHASLGRIFQNNLFAFRMIGSISPAFLIVKILQEAVKNVSILFEHTFLVAYIISCAESNASFVKVLYVQDVRLTGSLQICLSLSVPLIQGVSVLRLIIQYGREDPVPAQM